MRIIAGNARGRTLFAPAGKDTRPTSDKIRGALFNILGERVSGANVLDLFGGTGALALEAMSRGAAYAAICDSSKTAIKYIRRNAISVLGESFGEKADILCMDYKSAIRKLASKRFDIVFIDPPYAMSTAYADACERLLLANMLQDDCVLVLESAGRADVPDIDGLECRDVREYGETKLYFYRRRSE